MVSLETPAIFTFSAGGHSAVAADFTSQQTMDVIGCSGIESELRSYSFPDRETRLTSKENVENLSIVSQ